MKHLIAYITIFALVAFTDADHSQSYNQKFIDKWAPVARHLQKECGIPASIQIAQAIHESGGGRSNIAKQANNHFGIKAYKNWKGETYTTKHGTKYRAYKTENDGWVDHAKFLHDHYIMAVGKDWKHWCKWCRGYGGSKTYWQKEIKNIIEIHRLYELDN